MDDTTLQPAGDFLLTIRPQEGHFLALARGTPAGDAEGRFDPPWDDATLQRYLNWHSRQLVDPTPAATEQLGTIGTALFRSLPEEIRTLLHVSVGRVGAVRFLLDLQDPSLTMLPWEWLYDPFQEAFLAQAPATPLMRYLPSSRPAEPWLREEPLRVLLVVGLPADGAAEIAAAGRQSQLLLEQLHEEGKLRADILVRPGLDTLRWRLAQGSYHVLHVVTHGQRSGSQVHLELAQEAGPVEVLTAQSLAALVGEPRTLKAALLMACHAGEEVRRDNADILQPTPMAQALLEAGLLAVVAIQGAMPASAAPVFAEGFYQSLLLKEPVETAVTQGRKALAAHHALSWPLPALYTRAIALPRPRLFQRGIRRLKALPRASKVAAGLVPVLLLLVLVLNWALTPCLVTRAQRQGLELLAQGRTDEAIRAFQRGLDRDPDNAALLYNLGNAYEELPDYERAIDAYRQAIAANSSLDLAYNNLARIYLKVYGECDEAMVLLERAREVFQDVSVMPAWHKNMGWAYLCQGNYEQARVYLERARESQGDVPETLYLLAQVYRALGEPCQEQACLHDFLRFSNPADFSLEQEAAKSRLPAIECPESP